jgi:hypothetical protein
MIIGVMVNAVTTTVFGAVVRTIASAAVHVTRTVVVDTALALARVTVVETRDLMWRGVYGMLPPQKTVFASLVPLSEPETGNDNS